MAGSRVYKLGTVFSRTEALLKSKAIPEEAKPLWYNIYQKFPPKFSPEFGRPAPNMDIKKIFYEEDVLRARISKEYHRQSDYHNLTAKALTQSQKCVALYKSLVEDGKLSKEAMDEALEKTYKRREDR